MLEEFYVDDFNSGEDSVEEGWTIKTRLEEASFRLRKWCSNSAELMKMIRDDRVGEEAAWPQEENVKKDNDTHGKTTVGSHNELEDIRNRRSWEKFGFVWKTIIYNFDALIELSENLELTKRNLLKTIAKFFDPLGMLSPLTIGMKVLFQEVCQSKLELDERLPEAFQERWRKWVVR